MSKEYTYRFFAGEYEVVKVSDDWAAVLEELDREEYNNDHSETRRHCSLDALNLDGTYLPAKENVEEDIFSLLERDELRAAIHHLSPRQQNLITKVYFCGMSYAEIARQEHLEQSTIRKATDAAVKKLKKFLN